jgi:hypothetical protein
MHSLKQPDFGRINGLDQDGYSQLVSNPRLSAAGSVRLTVFRVTYPCEVLAILFRGLLSPIKQMKRAGLTPGPPIVGPAPRTTAL